MRELAWTKYGYAINGNEMWYVNYWGSLLCCFSLNENKIKRIENIPYEGNRSELLYSNVAIFDDVLVLVPANAFSVCFYNMETREFSFVKLDLSKEEYNFFCSCYMWKEKVYLIPFNVNKIMRLDINKKEITCVKELNVDTEKDGMSSVFQYNGVRCGQYAYFLSSNDNCIWRFDMELEKVLNVYIGEKGTILNAMELGNDGELIITDQNCNVYILSKELEILYVVFNDKGVVGNSLNSHMTYPVSCRIQNNIFIFLPDVQKIYIYKVSEKKICLINSKQEILRLNGQLAHAKFRYSTIKTYGENLLFFCGEEGQLVEYNYIKDKVDYLNNELKLDKEEASYFLTRKLQESKVVLEGRHTFDSLEKYVDIIIRGGEENG